MKLGSHVQHIPSGQRGTLMRLYTRDGIEYAVVLVDDSGGCVWLNFPVGEWEAI